MGVWISYEKPTTDTEENNFLLELSHSDMVLHFLIFRDPIIVYIDLMFFQIRFNVIKRIAVKPFKNIWKSFWWKKLKLTNNNEINVKSQEHCSDVPSKRMQQVFTVESIQVQFSTRETRRGKSYPSINVLYFPWNFELLSANVIEIKRN